MLRLSCFRAVLTGAFACLVLGVGLASAAQISPSVDAATRADQLIAEMTVDEKIGQVTQLFVIGRPSDSLRARVATGGLGSALFVTDPVIINQLQHIAVEQSRLHIPLLFGFDVIHGLRTIFPVPLAMAATWDPAEIERAQTVAAAEARAVGINWTFAPMVDIARDPRWGRIVEGAGEDPYLGSAVAAAQVRGFQGIQLGEAGHIMACAKHFAGYGAAEGGRDYDAVDLSDDQLWNVYLPPFHAAVQAGVGTIMSAYMDLNGVPATGNRWLLQNVLRDDWHFPGFVVSDADAVKSLQTHGFADSKEDAAARALGAGVDMEMALGAPAYGDTLAAGLREGRVTVAQLDAAVRPILIAKLQLGLFENPYVDESRASQLQVTPEHRAEARKAATEAAVLLRNSGGLLPLPPGRYHSVAVIGPLGDSREDIAGPWAFAGHAEDHVSILDGLVKSIPQIHFSHAEGVQISRVIPSPFGMLQHHKQTPWTREQAEAEFSKAVDLARQSDLVVLALGEAQDMDGEAASSSSLELPGEQQRLMEAAVAIGKPVVLVLMSARPLELRWATEHIPAILDIWYPGTEGGNAVADLLLGRAVPGGKLPITWPRDVGQVPLFYAHTRSHEPQRQDKRYWNEESSPLFPFGYGLSYATFSFSNLSISTPSVHKDEPISVAVDVQNTSAIAADEVAQLYIHQDAGTSSRPVRELKGFQRVHLSPGEKRTLHFVLSSADLTYWSSATHGWAHDASTFQVWAGGDSTATLHGTFSIRQ